MQTRLPSREPVTRGRSRTSHLVLSAWLIPLLLVLVMSISVVGPASAAFPGTNGKIAFVSDRDGRDGIYIMNPDGSGQTRLTDSIGRDRDPAWSPDGLEIAFTRNIADISEIYVMNADGSNQTRLASGPVGHPTWSPDGSKIAFESAQYGAPQIYVMNANGSHPVPLTPRLGYIRRGLVSPAWSPDGSKIAFVAVDWPSYSRTGTIMIGHFDLSQDIYKDAVLECHSYSSVKCGDPAWSPDGSRIALAANFYGTNNIRAGPTDSFIHYYDAIVGYDYSTLTESGENRHPAWSPDGSKIAFASNRDGNWEIYVMNADGSHQTRLTFKGGQEPDWQPMRTATTQATSTTAVTTSVTSIHQTSTVPTQSATENTIAYSGGSLSNTLPWIVLVTMVAVVGLFIARRRGAARRSVSVVAAAIPRGVFDVLVTVPSVGKTVTLEVAADHTLGSLVETLVSTLNLPKGKTYAIEYAGRLISQADFGNSLGTLGITEGSRLVLRVVQ